MRDRIEKITDGNGKIIYKVKPMGNFFGLFSFPLPGYYWCDGEIGAWGRFYRGRSKEVY